MLTRETLSLHENVDPFAKLAVGDYGPVTAPRGYASLLLGLAITLAAIGLGIAAIRNKAFGWNVVAEYLLSPEILHGLMLTLWMTIVVVILGFALGCLIALLGMANNPILKTAARLYVWGFRSTPILVQLLFWYNIGYIVPEFSLNIPFGPTLFSVDTRNIVTAGVAAILGLTFHEAAYAAEIVRGGILSIDKGQAEAGKALGLRSSSIFLNIVMPQAIRNMLPPAGNLVIGTLKGTSIVSVIAVSDLLYSAQLIYNRNYEIVPLLLVATFWYMVATTVFSAFQRWLERRFSAGHVRTRIVSAAGR
ncbi:amino acid ABC transporter permease [soil metagenome]